MARKFFAVTLAASVSLATIIGSASADHLDDGQEAVVTDALFLR